MIEIMNKAESVRKSPNRPNAEDYFGWDDSRTSELNTEAPLPENVARRAGQAVERDYEKQKAQKRSQRERKIGTTTVEHMRPIAQTLPLEMFDKPEFRSVYDEEEIQRDREYVEKTERRIQKKRLRESGSTESTPLEELADDFEVMVLYGIQRNAWLGNTIDENGKIPFKTYTSGATRFDDLKHRVDAFTTVEMTDPVENEENESSLVRFHMGFDATLSGNRDTIDEKIMRCQNDETLKVPFGFTQIKYYANSENGAVGRVELVPRFTLAINKQLADELRKVMNTQLTEGKQLENIKFKPGQNNLARFMVLSEIRAQTQLYYAMLPEELWQDEPPEGKDEAQWLKDKEIVMEAEAQLSQIDEKITGAMDVCAKRLSADGNVYYTGKEFIGVSTLTEGLYVKTARPKELRETIERNLIKQLDKPDGVHNDPYVLMIQRCRELEKVAKDGKFDRYRNLSAHTHRRLYPAVERASA